MSVNLPVTARSRSTKARREARLAKFERDKLIVEYLNRGFSIPEIAADIGLTEKRMRARVQEILARRMPVAPAEFAAMQVSRLNEALLVAYSAMKGLNLKAVDRVVKIVRELDRYHGFAAASRHVQDPRRLEASPQSPLALTPPLSERLEKALHRLDKIGFAPGNGMSPEDPVSEALAEPSALRLEASEEIPPVPAASAIDRPKKSLQSLDKVDSAPGNGDITLDIACVLWHGCGHRRYRRG